MPNDLNYKDGCHVSRGFIVEDIVQDIVQDIVEVDTQVYKVHAVLSQYPLPDISVQRIMYVQPRQPS
jgi:hypothetical protein